LSIYLIQKKKLTIKHLGFILLSLILTACNNVSISEHFLGDKYFYYESNTLNIYSDLDPAKEATLEELGNTVYSQRYKEDIKDLLKFKEIAKNETMKGIIASGKYIGFTDTYRLFAVEDTDKELIKKRFGFGKDKNGNPYRPHTLDELVIEYGKTKEKIRQMETKIIRKLKHPQKRKKLKEFFLSFSPTKSSNSSILLSMLFLGAPEIIRGIFKF